MSKKRKTYNLFLPIVLALVCGLLFVLIGCHQKAITPKPATVNQTLNRGFTASANFSFQDLKGKADIGKTTDGAFTFAVTEPKALDGLTLSYNGEHITADYRGLSFSLNDDSLLAKGAASVLIDAVNTASGDDGIKIGLESDAVVVSGNTDTGDFSMRLDKKSGAILSLNAPDSELTCTFENFLYSE